MNHQPRRSIDVKQVLQDIQIELRRPYGDPPSPLAEAITEARTFQQRFRASPVIGNLRLLKEISFSLNRATFVQQFQFNDRLLDLIDSLHLEVDRLTTELNRLSVVADDEEEEEINFEALPQPAESSWSTDQASNAPSITTPLHFSVIINTANRPAHLRTLLYSLERQTYPHFEVIVVVGPGGDETLAVLQEFAGRIRVVDCPVYNLSVSRNIGLATAAGDVVAYLDDDSIPALTWLTQLAQTLQPQEFTGTGGKLYRIHPDGSGDVQFLFGTSSVLGEDYDVRLTRDAPVPSDSPAAWWYPRLTGGNMAYLKDSLLEVGGFDERFAYMFEESDVAVRLGQRGYHLYPLAEAVVYHFPTGSPNRQAQYLYVNWYAWVKGQVYFALKNGIPMAGWRRAVDHALRSVMATFREISNYQQTTSLTSRRYWGVIWQIGRGLIAGFWLGLARPRAIPTTIKAINQTFLPFRDAHSPYIPCLMPSGRLLPPQVKPLPLVPLRLALINPFSETTLCHDLQKLVSQLAEAGHEVHLLKLGPVDRVTCVYGALVHEITPIFNRYSRYKQFGYSTIFKQLNYSHAVYEKVTSLMINHQLQAVISPLPGLEGLVTAIARIVPTLIWAKDDNFPQKDPEQQLQQALTLEFKQHSTAVLPPASSREVVIQACRSLV